MSIELIRTAISVIGNNAETHAEKVGNAAEAHANGLDDLKAAQFQLHHLNKSLLAAFTCFAEAAEMLTGSEDLAKAKEKANVAGLEESNNEQLQTIVAALGAITTDHDALLAKYQGLAKLYNPEGTGGESAPGGHIHLMTQIVETAIQLGESQAVFGDFAISTSELSTAVAEVDV